MKKLALLIIALFLLPALADAQTPPVTEFFGMYGTGAGAPTRLDTGADGTVYVTYRTFRNVTVYSNSGKILDTKRSVGEPVGIAVDDSTGWFYITDYGDRSVGAYDPGWVRRFKLGGGTNEFGFANDVDVAGGRVYVSDSNNDVIRVYSAATGAAYDLDPVTPGVQNSFGNNNGANNLNFPSGIQTDEAGDRIYVVDRRNKYIRAYDLSGVLKQNINGNVVAQSTPSGTIYALHSPAGVAVDAEWVYVSDTYYGVIAVFNRSTGAFQKHIGQVGTALGQFKTPNDVALDADHKIFVSNTNNSRIEAGGITPYTGLVVVPDELEFTVDAGGDAEVQTVQLRAVGSSTGWVATWDSGMIASVSPGTGTADTTGTAVDIEVDPVIFAGGGTYTTEVVFTTLGGGTTAAVEVTIEVTEQPSELIVAPSGMSFRHQKGRQELPGSQAILLSASRAPLDWQAWASAGWIALEGSLVTIEGTTPSSIQVSLTGDINDLAPGSYSETVTIDAGAVPNSPATVEVSLDLIEAGDIEVVTNLEEAGFIITGPESYSGSGLAWEALDAAPGEYIISFGHVSGYNRPYTRRFTVQTGQTVQIEGYYTVKEAYTHLIGAPAGASDEHTAVNILNMGGAVEGTLIPFVEHRGIGVKAGDMDGDGSEEIIVTDGKNTIKVLRADGTEVTATELTNRAEGVTFVADDLDRDGMAELIIGYAVKDASTERQEVAVYGLEGGQLVYRGHLLNEAWSKGGKIKVQMKDQHLTLATGDTDGDGKRELIIADRGQVRTYDIAEGLNGLTLLWRRALTGEQVRPEIAAGDIDDDGIDEICVGQGPHRSNATVIRVLNGQDGTDYGLELEVFGDLGYRSGVSVAMGDIDGDGEAEIAVGAGPGRGNATLIRLIDRDGQLIDTIDAQVGDAGVNTGLGRFAF